MSGIRRTPIVIGLTVGASIPTSGSASASTAAVPHRLDTLTGTRTPYSYWYDASVTRPAPTTARGVAGHLVMAHPNNGQPIVMAQTDAVICSVSGTVDRGYLAETPRVPVPTC